MSTSKVIDLRSDTVTRPTPAMREAMARAEVGDDVYGEDPTVRALETRLAERLGKQAALFVPSGTMANQIAIRIHTEPGDDVLCGEGAHTYLFESGGGAAISGCMFSVLGQGGLFTAADVAAAIKPSDDHYARTRLVCLENTHNRAGGRIFPQAEVMAIGQLAKERGLAVHLDGARLFNAHVATGLPLAELARPVDTVSVCLSKGLGTPLGSVLAGPRDLMVKAHRVRKMLGGGMRQVGIVAAAGLHALEHHVDRLADDHKSAQRLGERLAQCRGVRIDLAKVETNIVIFELDEAASGLTAPAFVAECKKLGVLINPIAPGRLRAVTHLDVSVADMDEAGDRVSGLLARLGRA
jgi:threonine aldolase